MNVNNLKEKLKKINGKLIQWIRLEPKKFAIALIAGIFIISFISVFIKGPSEVPEDNKVVADEKSEEEKRIEQEEKDKAKEEREKKREEIKQQQAEKEKEEAERDRIAKEENPQKFFMDKSEEAYKIRIAPYKSAKREYRININEDVSLGIINTKTHGKIKIQDNDENLIAYRSTINNSTAIYDYNDSLIGYVKSTDSDDKKKIVQFLNEDRREKGYIEFVRTVEKDKNNLEKYNEYKVHSGYKVAYIIKEKEGNKYEISKKESDVSVKPIELIMAINIMNK